MRRIALRAALLGLIVAGCQRKKSHPEFYRLESTHAWLVASEGDSAYQSDEMAKVVSGLSAIPGDSTEGPKAAALKKLIEAEHRRIEAERAEETKVMANNAPQEAPALPTSEGKSPEAEELDAGPDKPWGGMAEEQFVARFGSCFSKAPPAAVPDAGVASVQQLKSTTDCQRRFGTPQASTQYLFLDGGMWGTKVELLAPAPRAAEKPPEKQPPPPVDAGEPVLLVPGAPMPEGYEKTTVF